MPVQQKHLEQLQRCLQSLKRFQTNVWFCSGDSLKEVGITWYRAENKTEYIAVNIFASPGTVTRETGSGGSSIVSV